MYRFSLDTLLHFLWMWKFFILSELFHRTHYERIDLLLQLFFSSYIPQRRFAVEKLSLQKDYELMPFPRMQEKKNSLIELKVIKGTELFVIRTQFLTKDCFPD